VQIGEGTYGKVYRAKSKETGEIVALKKIRMANEKEGFPITAIREIKILRDLQHENIVQLKEIVTSAKSSKDGNKEKKNTGIYMVFEYMDHDLTGLMINEGNKWHLTEPQIKCYMKQLLEGLHYCHSKGVLHRDIKGSNLLISNTGLLKLADFGLARGFTEQGGNYTNRVITLWYRPPELLLGATQYGPAIDMWSVGCIMAELLTRQAIFPGRNEVDQLELIFQICGSPDKESWPDHQLLPWNHLMGKAQRSYKRCLREKFKNYSTPTIDLLDKLLTLDPKKRITAAQALDSDYFWTEPLPCEPSELPRYKEASHEFSAKKRRNQHQGDPSKRQKGPRGAPVAGPPSGPTYVPPPSSRTSFPPSSHTSSQPTGGYDRDGRHPPQQQSRGPPPSSSSSTSSTSSSSSSSSSQGRPMHSSRPAPQNRGPAAPTGGHSYPPAPSHVHSKHPSGHDGHSGSSSSHHGHHGSSSGRPPAHGDGSSERRP